MRPDEYVKEASRTRKHLLSKVNDNIHMLLGLTDELGELVKGYKANLVYNKPIDMVNVQEELGDLMWFIANFCDINGLSLESIMKANIAKLSARYPEKYDDNLAVERNLERERIILEELGYK